MREKSIELSDAKDHREQLNLWLDEMAKQNPEGAANLKKFLGELFKIFTDKPPYTWRFRITTYKGPIFRLHYRQTGRENDFLIICSGRLIIINKFFNENFSELFPIKKDYYGQGRGVLIDFSLFDEEKQKKYLQAIETMAKGRPDQWYIRAIS
ncbi:MAG: hypothetical protein QHH43_02500 [Candidatus Saccharicenans sp.]|jgi:hypothetical protein|nr:hypothetical protein [Candidatus Saccharicenans sp.]MDH7574615.1 hypothetical protein [Candidatus Saccharicenans sp.]